MIKLMIDSAADIGLDEARELGIIMLPMVITIGESEYLDGVDLTPQGFYEKLLSTDVLPKTSQVTPFRFEEAFCEHTKDGSDLIVITISSKLSGTYNGAVESAKAFGGKVRVIDSLNACIGERLLVLYAVSLIKEGLGVDEIVQKLESYKSKIRVIALLDTLEYLKKGGRISSAVAFAGELISLKPIIGVIDGEVKLIGKAIGTKKGVNLLNKLVSECNGVNYDMPHGAVWSGLSNVAIEKYLSGSTSLWGDRADTMPRYQLGATIGTHVGPGVVGVAFFEE